MSQTFEPQILNHPLIQHKISLMRKKETGSKDFRELASEVATLMCYEATRDLPLKEVTVETPICRCKTKMLAGRKLAIVPILRAGLGMVDGMLTLIPAAKVGHIGLYRDEETAKPIEYFCKLPCDISEREVIVVDPMLATGGSAIDAVSMIKKHGAANPVSLAIPKGEGKCSASPPLAVRFIWYRRCGHRHRRDRAQCSCFRSAFRPAHRHKP